MVAAKRALNRWPDPPYKELNMEDIELPDLPKSAGWAPVMKCDIYTAEQMRAYAIADREKRAQAAQPGQGKELHDRLIAEIRNLMSARDVPAKWGCVGPDAEDLAWDRVRELVNFICVGIDSPPAPTEASKPVQAEAPTASNERARIDLSQWEKARFGYFDQAGLFVEFSGEDNELPNDSSPRWVGGRHDMQLLRAALATQQAEAPHSALMKFYGVDNLSALVEAQHRHIEKLQAKLPRNDQPAFTRVREG